MATKLKVNYEFVGDSTTPVSRTNSIKHGDKMLNKVIDDMSTYVTPEMFGAVGDGVTDDTSAVRSAVNSLIGSGGGTLFFPKGSYLITSTIACDSETAYVNLLGSGDHGFIKFNGNGVLFEYSHTSPYHKLLIEKLYIKNVSENPNTAFYIHGEACCNTTISNNKIWGFGICIRCDGECDEWTVLANHFVAYKQYGIKAEGAYNSIWTVISNHFESGDDGSIAIYGKIGTSTIMSNTIQSVKAISGINISNISRLIISGLYYETLDQARLTSCIELTNCTIVEIHNFAHMGVDNSAIKLNGCEDISIYSMRHSPSGGTTKYIIENDENCKRIMLYQKFFYENLYVEFLTKNPIDYYYDFYLNDGLIYKNNILEVSERYQVNQNGYSYAEFDLTNKVKINCDYKLNITLSDENGYFDGVICCRASGIGLFENSSNLLNRADDHPIQVDGYKIKVFNPIGGLRTIGFVLNKLT